MKQIALFLALASISSQLQAAEIADSQNQSLLEELGRTLFTDRNLSLDRTISCASCHDPGRGFIDWRGSPAGLAASVGNDGVSVGDRSAPTISYASLIPAFHVNSEGQYEGGMFWDGREPDLEGQAGGPFLNTIEMQMPDKAAVIERILEDDLYPFMFMDLFGDDVFDDVDTAYRRMTEAIAAAERTAFFSPFDSRYDRYLQGTYEPTEQEMLGMTLFFSEQFTNCNQCHQLKPFAESEGETFTNNQYFNVATPMNRALRAANGLGEGHVDRGLLENPLVDDPAQAGKFKTPTLRNVAMTAPYMHNGVFGDLKTVVQFYNKFNLRGPARDADPDTGEPWGEPEVAENIDMEKLESGNALDERSIDALVIFMKMLTDQRYEHLVK
jgi:cytochrome c peroxidase